VNHVATYGLEIGIIRGALEEDARHLDLAEGLGRGHTMVSVDDRVVTTGDQDRWPPALELDQRVDVGWVDTAVSQ
jgi:hypothetical protein